MKPYNINGNKSKRKKKEIMSSLTGADMVHELKMTTEMV
jgi:hypothetical protein